MSARYDTIGRGYADVRRPDPRIAALITAALGDVMSVLNVGAGAGSYEPAGRRVVAVEPSEVMVRQRPAAAAPVVRGVAEALPFGDGCFDAAMAILTVHHWTDPERGLAELRRVSRRQVVLTWDDAVTADYWLLRDYLPEVRRMEADYPTLAQIRAALGAGARVTAVPIPHDCTDGMLAAYWRRPEAYLDAAVQEGISALAFLPTGVRRAGLARLAADLGSGEWTRRHGQLLDLDTLDVGYRLVVAG